MKKTITDYHILNRIEEEAGLPLTPEPQHMKVRRIKRTERAFMLKQVVATSGLVLAMLSFILFWVWAGGALGPSGWLAGGRKTTKPLPANWLVEPHNQFLLVPQEKLVQESGGADVPIANFVCANSWDEGVHEITVNGKIMDMFKCAEGTVYRYLYKPSQIYHSPGT